MNPRVEYEMSESDLDELLDACRPTPVMYLSGGTPMGGSPQENANAAWAALGRKMGFDSMTVRPHPTKGKRFFTAVPSETEAQRKEREELKKEAERQEEIKTLKQTIKEAQERLDTLIVKE